MLMKYCRTKVDITKATAADLAANTVLVPNAKILQTCEHVSLSSKPPSSTAAPCRGACVQGGSGPLNGTHHSRHPAGVTSEEGLCMAVGGRGARRSRRREIQPKSPSTDQRAIGGVKVVDLRVTRGEGVSGEELRCEKRNEAKQSSKRSQARLSGGQAPRLSGPQQTSKSGRASKRRVEAAQRREGPGNPM